jgi:hypothetical protein
MAHVIQRFAEFLQHVIRIKATCACTVWERPESPLSLVYEALSTLENLV